MILIITVFLICAPFLWWYSFLQKYKSLDVIPGPKPLPIIGNSHHLGNTPQDLLNNCMKLFRRYGDLFKIYIANEVKVFIANPDILEQIMNSNIHITKSDGYLLLQPWIDNGLLMSTGKKWKSRRKMITPSFHFKILEEFLEVFNSCGNILVEKLSKEVGKDSVDVHPYMNLFALDVVCETAMGVKISSQEGKNKEYSDSVREFLNILMVRFFSAWKRFDSLFRFSSEYKKNIHLLNVLNKFSKNVISKRRLEKSQQSQQESTSSDLGIKRKVALLDMLLESEYENILTDGDIREEINTFMFEGHDTTTSALCFSMIALADHPDVQERVYDEIMSVVGEESNITMQHMQDTKYLDMVIKEVQRKYPAVPFVERRLETDANIGGIDFPKDTTLTLFLYGAHFNEKYFPEPHIFDPDRFLIENQVERHNYAYVPFSAGPRNCIGQKFAMIDIKTTVIKILQKFRVLQVPNYKPELGMASILKSYNGICVRLEDRHATV